MQFNLAVILCIILGVRYSRSAALKENCTVSNDMTSNPITDTITLEVDLKNDTTVQDQSGSTLAYGTRFLFDVPEACPSGQQINNAGVCAKMYIFEIHVSAVFLHYLQPSNYGSQQYPAPVQYQQYPPPYQQHPSPYQQQPIPYQYPNPSFNGYSNPYNYHNQIPSPVRPYPVMKTRQEAVKIPRLGFRKGAVIDYEYIYDINDLTNVKSSNVKFLSEGHNNNRPERHNFAEDVSVNTLISQDNDARFQTVTRRTPVVKLSPELVDSETYDSKDKPNYPPEVNDVEDSTVFKPISETKIYKSIPMEPPAIKDDYEEGYDEYEADHEYETNGMNETNTTESTDASTKSFWSWG